MKAVSPSHGILAPVLLLLLTATSTLHAQTITAIRFDPPDSILEPEDLATKLSTIKIGDVLKTANVRLAIEHLFATGRFDDIVADAQPEGNGVAVVFRTKPAAFIRNVTVDGISEPPNAGQAGNATKLQLGYPYSEAQVRQATESLLEVLRSNGFYLAKVTPESIPAPFQQIDVSFHVDTGKRARYSTPIITGTPNKPADQIIRATRWQRVYGLLGWREMTDSRTSQGVDRVRRLYQKKNFLQARTAIEQIRFIEKENRVVPVLNVESGPEVVVKTVGAKISKGRLRELLPIYQELTVDKDLLVEGKKEITEYMQARGYFDAEVDFTSDQEKNQQQIEYVIAPGDRHKLVLLGIKGNRYFDTETIRERMYITPATFLRFRRGRYSEAFLRRDLVAIRALYQSNGFRDIQVKSRTEDDYEGKENEEAVFIDIVEGPQWFVSNLLIQGVSAEQAEDLRALISSTEGQPFSDFNVASDQDAVLNYFFNSGYPDATFEATVTPAADPNRMDIKYLVHPGARQYVRDVLISGLTTTNRALVQSRILNLEPGSPLSQSSMIENQRRLYDLGIFARVDAAIQNPEGDTDYKYVLYRFEEARRWFVNGGFGAQIARIGRGSVTNFDSPAGAPGFSPRVSLGVSRSNFLGLGHTISLQTRLSNIQRRGLISYVAPQFSGSENLNFIFTTLYDDSRDVQTFDSRRQESSAQISQRLTKANTLQYRLAYRRVTASNIKITPALVPLLSQPVQLGIASMTFIQDRRDDPTDARRGIWNTIDAGYASNFFGSKTSFFRAVGRNATYHRLSKDLLFARTTQFGVINRISRADVPLPERFFAGGAVSHRGFPENQAGSRDLLTGFPIGGKALLINTHELRFPLLGENIGGVFFHDAGNLYSNFNKISARFNQRDLKDFDYMVHSLGFGIRYRTPIGPVRIDLSYGLNPPRFMGLKGTQEQLLDPNLTGVQFLAQRISRFQFHFSLGQLF